MNSHRAAMPDVLFSGGGMCWSTPACKRLNDTDISCRSLHPGTTYKGVKGQLLSNGDCYSVRLVQGSGPRNHADSAVKLPTYFSIKFLVFSTPRSSLPGLIHAQDKTLLLR